MQSEQKSIVRIIDNTIFLFSLIFLLSLSNSIFVNQIGYFGALFFILVRLLITRENQFKKTGLELAFLLYILAEILSTIFSDHFSHSLQNLSKRVLLIPVVYTMIAVTTDLSRGKLFFKVYIIGTLSTVLIYLYFSFDHFINNLYNLTQSGPSLFQYPITASEIMSFAVIFLFAFLVNEKSSLWTKLIIAFGFIISSLALIATYKRTGWIGAAFGILIILIMRKQWKTLAAGVILLIILFMYEKNISEIIVYDFDESGLRKYYLIQTDGRASNIYGLQDYTVVSDYENGISVYKDSVLVKNQSMPAPVKSFSKWKDDLFAAHLIDTRFIILSERWSEFQK
jgi:hypothetical protein